MRTVNFGFNILVELTDHLPHEREGLRVRIAFSLLEAAINQPLAALGRWQRS